MLGLRTLVCVLPLLSKHRQAAENRSVLGLIGLQAVIRCGLSSLPAKIHSRLLPLGSLHILKVLLHGRSLVLFRRRLSQAALARLRVKRRGLPRYVGVRFHRRGPL